MQNAECIIIFCGCVRIRDAQHLCEKQNADVCGLEMRSISAKSKNADVAERQTRWFQVPVSRDVWVQIPSSAPGEALPLLFLLFVRKQSLLADAVESDFGVERRVDFARANI